MLNVTKFPLPKTSLILMFNIQQVLKIPTLNAQKTRDFSRTAFNATNTTNVEMELPKNIYALTVLFLMRLLNDSTNATNLSTSIAEIERNYVSQLKPLKMWPLLRSICNRNASWHQRILPKKKRNFLPSWWDRLRCFLYLRWWWIYRTKMFRGSFVRGILGNLRLARRCKPRKLPR